ncbi:MAG: AzlD domain-containing protein [Oscillospiraceae bacterium]|nr:AzlD domain-containing protein [Oscillospiraceae bacterium]
MNKYVYITLAILISAAMTFILRLIPFAIFSRKPMPRLMQRLAKLLPSAIIAVLVIYCIKDAVFSSAAELIITLASVGVVVGLHLWKKQTLLSIAGGTIVYMAALRIFL